MSKPIVIIGPPGTGKTTFILNKIEEYLQDDVKIDDIGFFSFSNKAVDEAKQRAADKFQIPMKDLENFTTLHSFALRQMSLSREYIMSNNDWRNVSDVLRIKINVTNDDDNFFNSYDEKYIHLIEKAKRRDMDIDTAWSMFAQDIVKHKLDYIAKGLQEYKDYGYENFTDGVNGYMVKDVGPKKDFTDLIIDYVNSKKVKEFKVVFFDEAQDMSTIQWKMAEKIYNNAETSYIAMDPNQAIYTWADADVERALAIKENAEKVIVLDQSRRVPEQVWRVVNRVEERIINNDEIQWKPAERDGHVEYVRNIYHLDMSKNSWLIMGRTRSIRDDLEDMLIKKNVFFRVKMRDNKYRYSVKAKERNAILTWKDLTIHKNTVSLKMVENMYKVLGKDYVTRGYKKIVTEQRKALPDKKVDYDELVKDYGLTAPHDKEWYEVMTTLTTEISSYLRNLEKIGEDISKEPRITLSTIHQQKGGEADSVVVSLDIGKMAYKDFKKNPMSEHRLFYVAFSRARENLYILTPTSREAYRV